MSCRQGGFIGDCTCHYDTEDVFILALKTDQGLVGWGFGETVSKGVFTKPTPWLTPMPGVDELRQDFAEHVWPLMQQSELQPLWERSEELFPSFSYRSVAIRTALWDLMARNSLCTSCWVQKVIACERTAAVSISH